MMNRFDEFIRKSDKSVDDYTLYHFKNFPGLMTISNDKLTRNLSNTSERGLIKVIRLIPILFNIRTPYWKTN